MRLPVRLFTAAGPLLLALMTTGCPEKEMAAPPIPASAAAPTPPASAAAAAPSASGAPDETVTPPAPVVSGDPDVPINEGIVGTTPLPADYAAETPPPAPVIEDKPPPPQPSYVWVPGYWWWSRTSKHYAWVAGGWRNPPPEHIWTPGAWTLGSPAHYSWRPGFWGPKGYVAEVIETAPPPPRVEPQPPMPGAGYVWGPGYYAWKNKAYEWSAGSWQRPPHEGYGWVRPTYVPIGGHYYFQPGRWDHPIAERGIAYRPEPALKPGEHFKPVALPAAIVAEHENWVVRSNEAVALGATRLPSGGYVIHHVVEHPVPPPPHHP
jgi:hypothetical protein